MRVVLPKSWHPKQIDDGEKRSIALVPGHWRERRRHRRRAASATTSRGQPVVDVRNFFLSLCRILSSIVRIQVYCASQFYNHFRALPS